MSYQSLKFLSFMHIFESYITWYDYEYMKMKIKKWKLTSFKEVYLAGDSSAVENRTFRNCFVIKRMWVHINWIKPFMPGKEFLPQWSQWQWPFCQEHESNFCYSGIFTLNHWRCFPKQLIITRVALDESLCFQRNASSVCWSKWRYCHGE